MERAIVGLALLIGSSAAAAAPPTDFGVRPAPGASTAELLPVSSQVAAIQTTPIRSSPSLASAVAVVSNLGRVTSTRRTPQRNRAVGGVPNSYHLSGRAIDVVRRSGVRHADIEAALRNAGFNLVESLDERDHSHFAFGGAAAPARRWRPPQQGTEVTQWRIVTAPRLSSR